MIGTPRAHWRLTDSTNERAKELAAAGAPHGTLVTADEQSAGRGRQGRVWTAPPRSALLMSLVVRNAGEMLPLAAAVAVCEALPVDCEIKWPNDVWLERRKLAGILVEGRPQQRWAVLGLGVNVHTTEFPAELQGVATSLRLAGIEADVEAILRQILLSLERWLEAPHPAVLDAWRRRDAIRGETVRWASGQGTAAGIDDSGALLVEIGESRITLEAGEIHLLR
jgi:BirA family transcriptional regulator, biotin operon repressor / biotin---[acetyl-CoA-carboxylase] ligase